MPSAESLPHRLPWRPGMPRTWAIESARVDVDPAVERLVVVSDLHSYQEPLDAIDRWLASLDDRYVVFVNGDLFEGGMDAAVTVDWVRKRASGRTTRGNHDSRIFAYQQQQTDEEPPGQWRADGELGAYQTLSGEQLDFVAGLPDQLDVHWRGMSLALLHGHQNHHDPTYTEWRSTVDQLVDLYIDPQVDMTVIGHTHYPFVRCRNGVCVANSGSVVTPICRFRNTDGSVENRCEHDEGVADDESRPSLLSITQVDGRLCAEIVWFTFDQAGMLDRYAARDDLNMPINFRTCWVKQGFYDQTVT